MGCVCGRSLAASDNLGSPPVSLPSSRLTAPASLRGPSRTASGIEPSLPKESRLSLASSDAVDSSGSGGCRPRKKIPRRSEVGAELRSGVGYLSSGHLGGLRFGVPGAAQGENVAAGWPSWLAAVASEAVYGWVPRDLDTFLTMEKIGQGTYSTVYRARDLLTKKIVALKKVRFDNLERDSVQFMAREIIILRRLDHPNIINLEGLIASQNSRSIYLVFEYAEHDLYGLTSLPGQKFSNPQIKCYIQQLLHGLHHCHSHGILHRDIKCANLLINNNGILKIADFGLANFFDSELRQPLTSRVVTLWYRAPELLLGATHYGVAVDLWSAGCILAELYSGKPILPGRTEIEQLHKIFKLCGSPSEDFWRKYKLPQSAIFKPQNPYPRYISQVYKNIPPPALALVERLLSFDPAERGTALSALQSQFFSSDPPPCDPSSLPKYPSSKELDAKRREDARREAAGGGGSNLQVPYLERGAARAKELPGSGTNAQAALSSQPQRRISRSNTKSEALDSDKDAALEQEANSHSLNARRVFHSGPLVTQPQQSKHPRRRDSSISYSELGNPSAGRPYMPTGLKTVSESSSETNTETSVHQKLGNPESGNEHSVDGEVNLKNQLDMPKNERNGGLERHYNNEFSKNNMDENRCNQVQDVRLSRSGKTRSGPVSGGS